MTLCIYKNSLTDFLGNDSKAFGTFRESLLLNVLSSINTIIVKIEFAQEPSEVKVH